MRILVTGGSGALGRALLPLLRGAGHRIDAPGREQLDLFAAASVEAAMRGIEAVFHLATRIPPRASQGDPSAWRENDRLRSEATRILIEAALRGGAECFVFPSVAFVYPSAGPADESTPVADDVLESARSALDAESEVTRFARHGGRGVILRLGLLYGPGTGSDTPAPRYASFGATLRIEDAGRALAAALNVPSGVYNVVRDGERVSNARFAQAANWRPHY